MWDARIWACWSCFPTFERESKGQIQPGLRGSGMGQGVRRVRTHGGRCTLESMRKSSGAQGVRPAHPQRGKEGPHCHICTLNRPGCACRCYNGGGLQYEHARPPPQKNSIVLDLESLCWSKTRMESWPCSLQVGDLTSLASVSLPVKQANNSYQPPPWSGPYICFTYMC